MNTITVDKEKFRDTVATNKAKHEELFHEASAAFYIKLHEKIEKWENKLGRKEMNFTDFIKAVNTIQRDHPQGHCDEYQQILDQLEWEQGTTVQLAPHEFNQFVKDEWQWAGAFNTSYTNLTGKTIG